MTAWKPVPGDWVTVLRKHAARVVPCPAKYLNINGPGMVWVVDPGEPDADAGWVTLSEVAPADPEAVKAAKLADLAGGGL